MGVIKRGDGIVKRGDWYHFQMRVPRRFAEYDTRTHVRLPLGTTCPREAKARAPLVRVECLAYWEALAAGATEDAARRFEAARALCEARGLPYCLAADLAQPEALTDLLARLESLADPRGGLPSEPEMEAVLGLVAPPPLAFSAALARFYELTPDRIAEKSPRQVARWRNDRDRAVGYFLEAVGDLPLPEITREHGLRFRAWWQTKVTAEGREPETANKSIGHVSDVFKTVSDAMALDLANPFAGLKLRGRTHKRERPPFSPDWIASRLLAPGALDGLNSEARGAFLMLVNTGARPSEIVGALPEDIRLEAEVPHLAIRPRDGRTLKTRQSERDVPLLGVSLEAARAIRAAGGFVRYHLKADVFSATANKYLRSNSLLESPAHVVYSLRHSFEDRLLEAGVDDRLRAELMGHKTNRPAYGRGGSLALKAGAVARIAL